MKISKKLDREKQSQHRLQIQASDGQNTAQAVVTFTITDTNDNSPVFSRNFYSFDLQEDTPVGTIISRVEADDPDEGVAGEVTYKLASTWAESIFNLDVSTGVLTVARMVDFEEVRAVLM